MSVTDTIVGVQSQVNARWNGCAPSSGSTTFVCDAMTMTKLEGRLLMVLVFVSAGACGGSGGGGGPIVTGTLAGKIGGLSWTLASGETDAFLSMGQPNFFTTLYAETVATCTGAGFSVASNFLIVEIPMTPGDYTSSVTFVVDPQGANQNLITSTHVVVDAVTATTVSGGISASYDGNNSVSGQFQATICAQ